jgi:hypothetical protein
MKRRFLLYFLMIFSPFGLSAQQVHGTVIDASSQEPMPFVSIAVVGTTFGTVSNQNGEFTLSGDITLLSDSIAFYYLGYETIKLKISDLRDGVLVKIKEKPVGLREITIVAKPFKPEELIRRAVERRKENYPQVAQKREVFNRSNTASYINTFDLSLKKSDIPEFDKNLIRQMVDSLPRYSRSYEDYLYTLYTIPTDSAKNKNKIEGIKNVVLREDNGGGLDNVKRIITELFVNKNDENTFWKYRTGLLSFKEDRVKINTPANDSTYLKKLMPLYFMHGDLGWDWDFIQKPGRYQYKNLGIIGIGEEDAYAISFAGKSRSDYQGMIYISMESFAILRIDYSLKESKKDDGIDMLGISYSEEQKSGLVLYEKDKMGYFLKYSMRSTATRYGIDRPFELIRKEKRPIISKKVNEAALKLNLQGLQEACYETLVVYRESYSQEKFNRIQEKGVKPERITSYSDDIWKGYSIIEPTRQMKEYQIKIKN